MPKRPHTGFTHYTADDFSSDSDADDNDPPNTQPGLSSSSFTSSLSSDRRRIIKKPLSVGMHPAKRSRSITGGLASMSVLEDHNNDKPGANAESYDMASSHSDSSRSQEELGGLDHRMDVDDAEQPWASIGIADDLPMASDAERKGQYLREWLSLRDDYLRMLLIGEGRGDSSRNICRSCNGTGSEAKFRCCDCFSIELVCQSCILKRHQDRPLDILEAWNGRFFERVSLVDLGLVVQLGHLSNNPCPAPNTSTPKNFTVIHTNGFHRVRVHYCECPKARKFPHMYQQLLVHGWYPATTKVPQTCFSFRLLEQFHIMTLVGKINAYDYYRGLEKLTNNAGDLAFKSRYDSFRRSVREWRHLKMLKRGGRGCSASSPVNETKSGELAVSCPACPHPGINLPSDWQSTCPEKRFLYGLFLAVDACFRLKRKLVSSEATDPGLGTGWSYMVCDEPYRRYLLTTTNESEMSTCSGLAALDHANSRNSRGHYATSGVALGCCARHEFIQPNGVGDLQKGERYCNVDWVLSCILDHHDCRLKYSKRLTERLLSLPPDRRPSTIPEFTFVVPKLHLYGHTPHCQANYSLNYSPGVGRTDGEGVERNWAGQGPISTSTTEMGPGSRHDTLDDHWGYWNWQKLVGLGLLLLRRLRLAVEWKNKTESLHNAYCLNQSSHIDKWKKMVEEFEEDHTRPNPYELPESGLTMQQMRRELAEEELKSFSEGQSLDQAAEQFAKSASAFIILALEIEERQRQLKQDVDLRNRGSRAKQTSDIVDKRLRLRKLLARFEVQQIHFMPIVASLRAEVAANASGPIEVENLPLYLPSSLSQQQRAACLTPTLASIEFRLRNAQCSESLDELRNQLLIKSRLITYKEGQARHQEQLRQTSQLLEQNQRKIQLHAARYQAAWDAYGKLHDGTVPWRKLRPSDIRCMGDPDQVSGNSRKRLGKTSRTTGMVRAQEIMHGVSPSGEEEDRDSNEDEDQDAGGEVSLQTLERQRRKKRDELIQKTGEGFRKIPWIWQAADGKGYASDESLYNGLRVEWAKSYARLRRWQEEVLLLREEMRRTLATLSWTASIWDSRTLNTGFLDDHAEGATAYAHRQADILRRLKDRFEILWTNSRIENEEAEEGDKEAASDVGEDGNDSAEFLWLFDDICLTITDGSSTTDSRCGSTQACSNYSKSEVDTHKLQANTEGSSGSTGSKGKKAAVPKKGAEKENDELQLLKAQLEKERCEREELESKLKSSEEEHAKALQAAQKSSKSSDEIEVLNKPPGEAGSRRGYNLREAMGLADDKAKYDKMVAAIKACAARAGINRRELYKNVESEKMALCFKLMRGKFDYLTRKRFPADWAQAAMLKQTLSNQRKYDKKRSDGNDEEDEDEEDEGEGARGESGADSGNGGGDNSNDDDGERLPNIDDDDGEDGTGEDGEDGDSSAE
ncbi:hypothetical protein VNI00_015557 [Paramarasmius palmivorus]|uniref:CxC2-like cysteine cluster KDZ transposase-associated domain-containing protein n=1 Tax=Paramarasmius palmivorus TaxID=297713 RepID=A0AAW0BN17_9AGAR